MENAASGPEGAHLSLGLQMSGTALLWADTAQDSAAFSPV